MNEGASLLTTSHLKERGWTPTLVKKFLGTPDVKGPNPYYRPWQYSQYGLPYEREIICHDFSIL